MSIQAINQLLYRPISPSKKYDKYFPKVSCQSTFLKETTTTGGLGLMKQWSKKFASQTEKIANELQGKSLPETINNIYTWLYNHLQYDADGYEQKLKSPACSYFMRFEGIDCKSYSLFASSILSNLGIAHKFRKVVQPSDPSRWSHVYVVIPYMNSELIIDATKSINTEVNKIKEFDMSVIDVKLPYYGMNASMGSPIRDINKTVQNFVAFLGDLNKRGVSKLTTNSIKQDIRSFIDKGIEPKVTITNEYFQVNEKRHYYNVSSASGLGFVSFDNITSLVDDIGVGHIFDRGFGQVFDNGFDFSCWGASFPPSLAEPQTNAKVKDIFKKYNLLNVVKSRNLVATKSVVNNVIAQLTFGRNDRKANISRAQDCTKKGEELSYKIFNQALESLYAALDADFNVQYITRNRSISFEFRGGSWTRNYEVKEINIIEFNNSSSGNGDGFGDIKPPVDTTDNTDTTNPVGNPGTPPSTQKNNKGVYAVLGTAVTAGALLFS